MDTIFYFYKKRNAQKPLVISVQMEDYVLIKTGLDVGRERWFSHALPQGKETIPQEAVSSGHGVFSLKNFMGKIRARHEDNRLKKQKKIRLREETEQIYREMQGFIEELGALADDRYECSCVYTDDVRKYLLRQEAPRTNALEGQSGPHDASSEVFLSGLWENFWQYSEFDAYTAPRWAKLLLKHARFNHFVALGTAECAATVILGCASKMRSLRWFLEEKDYGGELQDFVDMFYEEYGLAAAVQILEGERPFARLLLETTEPVCILDFTGEPHIPAGGLARDSVWIDFCSVEEKAERAASGAPQIAYFSLKEVWKQAKP